MTENGNERWRGTVDTRLNHIEKQLEELVKRQNWALGIVVAAILVAIANWIIQGGLASG